MIPIATPVPPTITPRKLKNAARRTAFFGAREFEYITGATAFAVSWNPLINSNAHTSARQRPAKIIVESIDDEIGCRNRGEVFSLSMISWSHNLLEKANK